MNYFDVASRLSDSFISKIPGVGRLHSLIMRSLQWKHQLTAGEKWVEYSGARLYADTSDHVAKAISMRGEYESQTSEKIKNHLDTGDFAIDVGAHIGHHTVTMRQSVGADGRVWAFEPNPKNIDYINKTLDRNGWENVEHFSIALSDTESSSQLLVPNSDNTGTASLPDVNTKDARPQDSYTVETRQLTSILNERKRDKINLLKIDVEGGETAIIRDISQHLNNIETIILEFHARMIDEEDARDVFEILESSGEITYGNNNSVEADHVLTENAHIIWQSY